MSSAPRRLDDTVTVITGAGSGIGRALALEAARRGTRVLVADLDGVRAEAVAAEIAATGGIAVGTACDVADPMAMQALADNAIRHFGKVNLLCNNAGVSIGGTIEATKPEDVQWMFEVNVFGICHGLRAFAPLLRAAAARGEFAHVLNTGSENSLGTPTLGPIGVYNATKHAVLALSDTARIDLAPAGVGVSIVCPALVRTDLLNSRMHRPDRLGGARALPPAALPRIDALMAQAHDAETVAVVALDGVEAGEFMIVPHAEVRGFATERMDTIARALDAADARG